MTSGRVSQLDFGSDQVDLATGDAVIVAVPTHAAAALVPGLTVPQGYRSIANAHFKIDVPPGVPPMQGLVNATTEWIFAFEGRLSVTISSADRLMDVPRAELAQTIWTEVAKATGIAADLPPWQIVRERRATFAATPAENAKAPRRPHPMGEPVPGRRLDRDRTAGDARGRDALGPPRGRRS